MHSEPRNTLELPDKSFLGKWTITFGLSRMYPSYDAKIFIDLANKAKKTTWYDNDCVRNGYNVCHYVDVKGDKKLLIQCFKLYTKSNQTATDTEFEDNSEYQCRYSFDMDGPMSLNPGKNQLGNGPIKSDSIKFIWSLADFMMLIANDSLPDFKIRPENHSEFFELSYDIQEGQLFQKYFVNYSRQSLQSKQSVIETWLTSYELREFRRMCQIAFYERFQATR